MRAQHKNLSKRLASIAILGMGRLAGLFLKRLWLWIWRLSALMIRK